MIRVRSVVYRAKYRAIIPASAGMVAAPSDKVRDVILIGASSFRRSGHRDEAEDVEVVAAMCHVHRPRGVSRDDRGAIADWLRQVEIIGV